MCVAFSFSFPESGQLFNQPTGQLYLTGLSSPGRWKWAASVDSSIRIEFIDIKFIVRKLSIVRETGDCTHSYLSMANLKSNV